MQDFKRGTARANQLMFEYLTQGDGPLALCVHGFPDSPHSYRYLLPALADAGYRAVAPFTAGSPRPNCPLTATTSTPAPWLPTRSRCTRRSAATPIRSRSASATRPIFRRPWATTGDRSTPTGSAEEWAAEQAAAWGADLTPAHPVPARHPGRLPRHDPGTSQPGAGPLRPWITVRANRRRRALHDGAAPHRHQQADPGIPGCIVIVPHRHQHDGDHPSSAERCAMGYCPVKFLKPRA